jgi:hypothetical protein
MLLYAQDTTLLSVISVDERKLLRQFRITAGAGPDPVMAVTRR